MHTIDRIKLQEALTLIQHDDQGYFTAGKFVELFSKIPLEIEKVKVMDQVYRLTHYIYQDIWNIQTIITRLEWQKNLVIENKLDNMLSTLFVATDIHVFHSELRSIFDYIASIIQLITSTPGKTKSFNRLQNWVSNPNNIDKINKDWSDFILSCKWFQDIRRIRDNLIHEGAEPLVFPTTGRILFLINRSDYRKIVIPEIMFNENVVDFELYAGLYIGYILIYLEEFSKLVNKHLNLKQFNSKAKSYHRGFRISYDWINKILEQNLK